MIALEAKIFSHLFNYLAVSDSEIKILNHIVLILRRKKYERNLRYATGLNPFALEFSDSRKLGEANRANIILSLDILAGSRIFVPFAMKSTVETSWKFLADAGYLITERLPQRASFIKGKHHEVAPA